MITIDDFTPEELRELSQLMKEKQHKDLVAAREHADRRQLKNRWWPEGAQARWNRQQEVATVLNVEADRRDLMKEARAWAADCQWGESEFDEDWLDGLTDEQVLRGIDHHYDGGLDQFLRDSSSVYVRVMSAGLLRGGKVVWALSATPEGGE
jgi:hypothetical protein